MARRSARLQKRSPTPQRSDSDDSTCTWETASSHSAPQNERLPSVTEGDEPPMKTPRKAAVAIARKAVKSPQVPQLTDINGTPARTPKSRTPIKPAGEEMHPAHHHASTAKPLDEARWLGFQALGSQTAPPKSSAIAVGQTTPSRTPVPSTPGKAADHVSSPDFRFRFRFKSPLSVLSPTSNSILKEYKDDAETGGRALFKADEFTAPADVSPKRKVAVPKSKKSRFSDAHRKEFEKMDSIANHPSAFRADPSRFKPVISPMKKTPSKADINKPDSGARTWNKLKRTQSKMDMTESSKSIPASGLKRTRSKMDVAESTTRIPPTPLKRTQSQMDASSSSAPRAQSTVRLVPPSRDGRPPTQDGNTFAKRVKRTETDDAATTRPASHEGKADGQTVTARIATPARKITSQTALPRLASRLMTPTKASLARSQSVKAVKSQSMIPSLLRSSSKSNLFSPTNIGNAMKETIHDSIRKTSNSLHRVRSILRTPSRKFSEDPEKVAAGTHMSPPSDLGLQKALPSVPHTAPVKKHVNFTNSTLERAAQDNLGKSPSPMKFRAGSEVPSGAVIYPTLQAEVEYPALPERDEPLQDITPSRRLTFGGATSNTPGEFSFKSNKAISFPSPSGTIRMVRKSDASSLVDAKKRKLETLEESSDKENGEPAQDVGRSAKKVKHTPTEPPKTPSKTSSKLPRRTPNRGSAISKSRLAFLATPRRSKA